jgi:hypothetical protein
MTTDVYTRITDRIIAELEKGERPWMKPWNAEHAAGKISRPLRHNLQPKPAQEPEPEPEPEPDGRKTQTPKEPHGQRVQLELAF